MAFDRESLYCIGPDAGLTRFWTYETADTPETVDGGSYFRPARDELRIGDVICVTYRSGTAVSHLTDYVVTSRDNADVAIDNRYHSQFGINSGGKYNVRDYGAYGGAPTATNNAAFQKAASKCTTPACEIDVPPCESDEPSFPNYRISVPYLDSLGTSDSNGVFGSLTRIRARVVTEVRQNCPRNHVIEGIAGRQGNNGGTYDGPELRAGGALTTGIVRIGSTDLASMGSMLRHLVLNGGGFAGVLGVYSNSVNERSGLEDVLIRAVDGGVLYDRAGASASTPNNWRLRDIEVYLDSGFTRPGIDVMNGFGPSKIEGVTVLTLTNPTPVVGVPLFRLRGQFIKLEDSHGEGADIGVEIGGDGGFWCNGIEVNGFTAYNPTSMNGMTAVVRIRNTETNTFDIFLKRIGQNTKNTNGAITPLLVQDDHNGISIPVAGTHAVSTDMIGFYEFTGVYNAGTGGTTTGVQEVRTSHWIGTRSITLAAGANTDINPEYASVLKVTPDAGGTSVINSVLGGGIGREILLENVALAGGAIFTVVNASGLGSATGRLHGDAYANVVVNPGQACLIKYGTSGVANTWSARLA